MDGCITNFASVGSPLGYVTLRQVTSEGQDMGEKLHDETGSKRFGSHVFCLFLTTH